MSLTITYADKWQITGYPNYRITTTGILYNVKRGRPVKKCYKSRSVGYWLHGRFIPLAKLRLLLTKLPAQEQYPF